MNIFLPDSKGNGIKPGTVQSPVGCSAPGSAAAHAVSKSVPAAAMATDSRSRLLIVPRDDIFVSLVWGAEKSHVSLLRLNRFNQYLPGRVNILGIVIFRRRGIFESIELRVHACGAPLASMRKSDRKDGMCGLPSGPFT